MLSMFNEMEEENDVVQQERNLLWKSHQGWSELETVRTLPLPAGIRRHAR